MFKIVFSIYFLFHVLDSKSCPIFPANNIWNTPIDTLPVHNLSLQYVQSIGLATPLKADFGSGLWDNAPIGIPFNFVNGSKTTKYSVSFEYSDESEVGPYPIPVNYSLEGGLASTETDISSC